MAGPGVPRPGDTPAGKHGSTVWEEDKDIGHEKVATIIFLVLDAALQA